MTPPPQVNPSTTNTSNQITQANSLQASFTHQRTHSWQIPHNQQATATTMFGGQTSGDQSYSSNNKIAAMTCILKGLQHLNQSEYC